MIRVEKATIQNSYEHGKIIAHCFMPQIDSQIKEINAGFPDQYDIKCEMNKEC